MEISFFDGPLDRFLERVLIGGTWFLLRVATRCQLTIQYLHRQFFARFAVRKINPESVANAMRLLKVFSDASIGIAGPAHRLTKKVLLSYARDLMSATDAVSQRLGYQPVPVLKRA